MGCTSSKSAETVPSSPSPAPGRPLSSPKTLHHESVPAYETKTCASFSEGTSNLAYFGLLKAESGIQKVQLEDERRSRVVVGRSQFDDSSKTEGDGEGMVGIEGVAMTMRYVVLVPGGEVDVVKSVVEEAFKACDAMFNVFNEQSEISKLNKGKPGKKITLSEGMVALFGLIGTMVEITGGRYDPTAGAVKAKFVDILTREKRPATTKDMGYLKHAIGWNKCLNVDRERLTMTKNNANTMIDLNGIAKGYTVDFVGRGLRQKGYKSFYVDWAGDIVSAGKHPTGRPWRTAIMTPPALAHLFVCWSKDELHRALDKEDVEYLVDLDNVGQPDGQLAVCTSGDYFNVMKFGYHHVADLNSLSMMKAGDGSVASVTVVASTCAVADALATASITLRNVESAKHFLDKLATDFPHYRIAYCILARDGSRAVCPLFKPRRDYQAATQGLRMQRNPPDMLGIAMGLQRAPRVLGHLNIKSLQALEVDSLKTISVDPVPLVTFCLRDSSEEVEEIRASVSKGANTCCTFEYEDGILYKLSVKDILGLPSGALVVAEVTSVTSKNSVMGRPAEVQVLCHDIKTAFQSMLPSTRKSLPTMSLTDAVKAVERRVPSGVWLAVTSSALGEAHGLTATSVVVSNMCPGVLMFNIGLNSIFKAVLGGIGSKVRVYGLCKGHEQIAGAFVSKTSMDNSTLDTLENTASVFQTRVREVTEYADHALIITEIENFRYPRSPGIPLVWWNRSYASAADCAKNYSAYIWFGKPSLV